MWMCPPLWMCPRACRSGDHSGPELFDPDQWLDGGLDLTLDEVTSDQVVAEHIPDRAQHHGLVKGQVPLGDDSRLDGNSVKETALAVGLELALDLHEVVVGLGGFVGTSHPTLAEAGVQDGALHVGGVAARAHADGLDAPGAVVGVTTGTAGW